MKILIVSSYLPYPLFSGGHVRLYNIIKELSGKNEITLLCEKRPFQKEEDVAAVKKICKEVITVDRKRQWSFSNIIKSGFSTHSFLVTGHTQTQFKKIIDETLLKNNFDLIHVETYYVMQNLPQTKVPVVLIEHNIEYSVYAKFRESAAFFLRPFLSLDIAKIKREEEDCWKNAQALVAVSREDQAVMKKAGRDSFLVPNGVSTDQFVFKEKPATTTRKILFLGDFKWIQNRDAVTFIFKEIWPQISVRVKEKKEKFALKLWIVGRKIPDSIKTLTNDPDVLFDEKSSSLPTEKIFQDATLLLAPLRVGGGTSYKILESMSSGTPVVTMHMSADALSAQDGRDVLVGKTALELAEKCVTLLQDENLFKTISKNGRVLVEQHYTWKEIVKELEEAYKNVILNA